MSDIFDDKDEGEDWELMFADPIGIGKLLSAIDRHLAWCRTSDDEAMRMSDDEFRGAMIQLERAGDTIRSLLDTLDAIGNCLHPNQIDAACLYLETETNIFAGLAKALDKRYLTEKEIFRARRRVRSLWNALYAETRHGYTRATWFYLALRELVVVELRREIIATYSGAVTWTEENPSDIAGA